MTKTSNSMSEEELRNKVSDILNNEFYRGFESAVEGYGGRGSYNENELMKLITQYSLTKQLEARVDEREVDEEDRCEIEVGA